MGDPMTGRVMKRIVIDEQVFPPEMKELEQHLWSAMESVRLAREASEKAAWESPVTPHGTILSKDIQRVGGYLMEDGNRLEEGYEELDRLIRRYRTRTTS